MKKLLAFTIISLFIFHLSSGDDGISGSNAVINVSIVIDTSLDVSSLTADTVTADIGIFGNVQDSLDAHTDTLQALRTVSNQQQDSIAAHTDSIAALRAQLNKFQSDSAAFVTTATRLAVYIPGTLPSDLFTATPRDLDAGDGSEALPVAGDLIKCVAKADSAIFLRAAGTTSGLKFVWTRKIRP